MLETSGTRTYLRLVRPTAAGFSPLDYVQSPPPETEATGARDALASLNATVK